jgi:hypothetical protein
MAPEKYLKAIVPFAAGVALLLVDVLGVADIPDGVWISLLGVSPAVFAVPNKKKA